MGGRSSSAAKNFKKALDETLADVDDEDFTEYLHPLRRKRDSGNHQIGGRRNRFNVDDADASKTDPMESSVAAIVVSPV